MTVSTTALANPGLQPVYDASGNVQGLQGPGGVFQLRRANTAVILGDSITNQNYALTPSIALTSNGSVNSPSANVNMTAHKVTAIGTEVTISSAADAAYNGIWKVIAITDVNNFTVGLKVAPSGSATAQVGLSIIQTDNGWFNWANVFLGQRLQLLSNQGITGDTSAGVLSRVNNALSYNPGYLFVLAGINDFAGITSGTFAATVAQTWSNLKATYQAALNQGCAVVAMTITPVSTGYSSFANALVTPAINWINRKIRQFCAVTPGMVLVDSYGALVNPSSAGGFAITTAGATVLFDGLHPGQLGAYLMGLAIYIALNPILPQTGALVSSNLESYALDNNAKNVLNNPLFAYTSGGTLNAGVTGQIADGWQASASGSATAVASLVARTVAANGDALGNNQRLVVTQGAANDSATITSNVAYSNQITNGDILQGEADLAISGINNVQGIALIAQVTVGGVNYPYYAMGLYSGDKVTADYKGVFRTSPLTVPAGTITAMRLQVYIQFKNSYNAGSPGSVTPNRSASA